MIPPRRMAGRGRTFARFAPQLTAGLLALAVCGAAGAAPPQLGLPIACDPGRSCWIVNYVDHDPTDGVRDYACGTATYNVGPADAHQGTDFAIRDAAAMAAGVDVLAAAAGTVIATRDGMGDVSVAARGRSAVASRECGNGVRIDHGDGWFSQYCHMKKGSIAVVVGQEVAAGQRLGQVGLSGFSEYPHLHFQVEKNGRPIDPFVGTMDRAAGSMADRTAGSTVDRAAGGVACGPGRAPLWRADVLARLPYRPTVVYLAGFATGRPQATAARQDRYGAVVPATAPALVLWADSFNVRAGDRIRFSITGPSGEAVFTHTTRVERNQARRFTFSGRRRGAAVWPAGTYRGAVSILRGGSGNGDAEETVSSLTTTVEVR